MPHRCISYPAFGLISGCAAVAYGQDPAMLTDVVATSPDHLWVELVRSLGRPGVMMYVGYIVAKVIEKGPPALQIHVKISEDLEKVLVKKLGDKGDE